MTLQFPLKLTGRRTELLNWAKEIEHAVTYEMSAMQRLNVRAHDSTTRGRASVGCSHV